MVAPPHFSHWCSGWSVTPPLLLCERRHQFAAEGGDVRDDAAPDQVPLAEGGLVHPSRPCVLQIVLDAEGASRADALHYAGGDGDQPAVADDPDGLAGLVDLSDEAGDLRIPS